MLSLFSPTNLTSVNPDIFGIPDYASSLVWELVTNTSVSSSFWPAVDDISLRFYFHNGTTSDSSVPIEYPLFGSKQSPMTWSTFSQSMGRISLADQQSCCQACGNSTGVCSAEYLGTSNSSSFPESGNNGGSGGISKTVCGVIGAMVTLGVFLFALIALLAGGFRMVHKKSLASHIVGNGVDTKSETGG